MSVIKLEKKQYALSVLIFITTISLFAQVQMEDVVYLKDGSIVRGQVIEQIPNVSIKVQTKDGSIFVYKMENVLKIIKEPLKETPPEKKEKGAVSDIASAKVSTPRQYGEIGISFIMPAGINLNSKIWLGDFGLNFSGMYLEFHTGGYYQPFELKGIEGDIMYKFYENSKGNSYAFGSMGFAYTNLYNPVESQRLEATYGLLQAGINFYGFFGMGGLGVGNFNLDGRILLVQLTLQLGYSLNIGKSNQCCLTGF